MRRTFVVLGFLSAVRLAASTLPPEPVRGVAKAQWHSDLAFFSREMPKRHINAFHAVTREQFDAAVRELDARIDAAPDDEIVCGFMRLAALIGDGHTIVKLPGNWHRLLIKAAAFDDAWRVTAATPANRDLVGQRITAIDGVPIAEVVKRLMTLQSQDETEVLQRAGLTPIVVVPEILHGLGIATSSSEVTLTTDAATEVVKSIAFGDQLKQEWISAQRDVPLAQRNPAAAFEILPMPEAKAVFVEWRRYDDLAANAARLWQLVDAGKAEKVIIDLRQNGGGDFNVGRKQMVAQLAKRPAVKGFVLVGARTFSAAMVNAIDFRNTAHATLVGGPIGEKPNSYAEDDEFVLPASHLVVDYSTRFYKFVPDDAPNVVLPDVRAVATWDDFVAGRDPALERALSEK